MEVQPKQIERYVTLDGKIPFNEWYHKLHDNKTRDIIDKRLRRVSQGNLGDYSSVGNGVFELRIDYGPGYRIYFGQLGNLFVLLLCGGDKSTQSQDIEQAIKYWENYRR